jgi:hypothetical protein
VCKTCSVEGHTAKTCGRPPSASDATAAAVRPRQQSGGAAAENPVKMLEGVPYQDGEEQDALAKDADILCADWN